jgi:hypothetical protein
MPKKKAPTAGSSDGTLAGWGCVSQRALASTRTALAAATPAEPLGEALPDGRAGLLGDLQQEGPQRLAEDLQEVSHEQPPQGSSPHAGAETDKRYRLQWVEPGNEKAPRMCETLRVGGPLWAHSDVYMPKCEDRSSRGQVSWSTAVDLPAVAAESGQFGHRTSPPSSPAAGSRPPPPGATSGPHPT